MKALLCTRLGGPDDLSLEDIAEPVPGPGEAVVRITLAALNFFDTLIIAGRYQVKPELPFSPGGEAAGVVEALGPDTKGVSVGDRVIVHQKFGTCRERIAVSTRHLTPIPDAVSDEQAAGLTITYGTSLHALRDRAKLQPGETLAVLGASGGVGLAAVELGAIMGARVIACASSPEKLRVAEAHGATMSVDYAEPALRSLGWKGRYLVVGFAAGDIPRIPLNLALLKGIDIQGVHWGVFVDREPEAHAQNQRQLLAWVAEGRLTAKVHGVYPLADYAEALGILKRREAVGKVLLRM